jgi:hypothetical protein
VNGRYRTDAELESLRRSLVMVESNQLALTRDQALALVAQLIAERECVRRLTGGLDDPAR